MAGLQQLSTNLFPHRWKLFVVCMAGLAVSVVLIFLARSTMGFALAGPLVFLPWGLMCIGNSKNSLQAVFFSVFSLLGLAWPFIVLLG
jgi:hypothetical protein